MTVERLGRGLHRNVPAANAVVQGASPGVPAAVRSSNGRRRWRVRAGGVPAGARVVRRLSVAGAVVVATRVRPAGAVPADSPASRQTLVVPAGIPHTHIGLDSGVASTAGERGWASGSGTAMSTGAAAEGGASVMAARAEPDGRLLGRSLPAPGRLVDSPSAVAPADSSAAVRCAGVRWSSVRWTGRGWSRPDWRAAQWISVRWTRARQASVRWTSLPPAVPAPAMCWAAA
jgi:hypothetical protein